MLRMENVHKTYRLRGQVVTALADVSLEIVRGEFVAVVGPSGCGKSSLLLVLGGMLSPTSGQVFLDGHCLYELPADGRAALRRDRLGFVFQSFNLIPYLSALENVQVPLFLAGLAADEQRTRATRLLERLGLADRLDHKPSELSVGQQQRVALARTLANDPTVILADEPTGNLDPQTRETVLAFLGELHAEGRTIVMVTHDPAAAGKAQRVVSLVGGGLTLAGTGPRLH